MGDDTGMNRLRADFINDCCSLLTRPSAAAAAPLRSANRRTNETLDDGEEDETDDEGRVGVGNSAPRPRAVESSQATAALPPSFPEAVRSPRRPLASIVGLSVHVPPSFGLSVSLYCERALGPLIAVRGTTSMRATAKLSCSAVVPRSVRARQGPRSGRLRGVAATRLAPARQRHDAVRARPQCLWTME